VPENKACFYSKNAQSFLVM